ncbi:MAG TPA: TDT family transporter [Tissierellaceae bacterium]|nr:TDT family transporter [Tissierellaceae bacterium]
MEETIKKIPTPIVGLMLALAASGNLVQSYGELYRNIFGIISGIILILYLVKIVKYPKKVKEELKNPVVASVFPTLSMGIMLLSTYIKPFVPSLSFGIWIIGLVLHVVLIINFTSKYILNFNINQVFTSWFIPYVGIVVASVTAPVFEMLLLGRILFWFGLISYFILLPIVLKRVFKIKNIPEPAQPTISIFAAPVALCLAGYMNSFPEKSMFLVWILVGISQFSYLMVILQLPRLLKIKFYPSYSAFTFPLVISAISIKLTNGFLMNNGSSISILNYIVKIEEVIGIAIVLYVLIKYIDFVLKESIVNKPNKKQTYS